MEPVAISKELIATGKARITANPQAVDTTLGWAGIIGCTNCTMVVHNSIELLKASLVAYFIDLSIDQRPFGSIQTQAASSAPQMTGYPMSTHHSAS